MIETISNYNSNDNGSFYGDWQVVSKKTKKTEEVDTVFSFDEDISCSTHKIAKFAVKPASSKRRTRKQRPMNIGSLPETRSISAVPQKRKRSQSAKNCGQQHPAHDLLNHFSQTQYESFRTRCLRDRSQNEFGRSAEMSSLFRFWSYYLRSNFNETMYEEFKCLASEDRKANQFYASECLFRFYSYGLENSINDLLLEEFQEFVLDDLNKGRCYGLEKFWAFLKYRKDQKPIEIQPEITSYLSEIDQLSDFKKLESKMNPTVQPSSKKWRRKQM